MMVRPLAQSSNLLEPFACSPLRAPACAPACTAAAFPSVLHAACRRRACSPRRRSRRGKYGW